MENLVATPKPGQNMEPTSFRAQYQTLNEAGRFGEMEVESRIKSTTNAQPSEYHPLHPSTRSFEVPREQVTIEKIIGKGAFGQVAKGMVINLRGIPGKTIVAVKMLKGNKLLTLQAIYL